MAKTKTRISATTYVVSNLIYNLRWKIHMAIGKVANYLVRASDDVDKYRATRDRVQAGPLTPEEIEDLTGFQVSKVDADAAGRTASALGESLLATPITRPGLHDKGAILLNDALAAHGVGVRSVANIGARVDKVSALLAPRFPEISFISVDFQANLAEHNAGLAPAPNWTFLSGYALDLMKAGRLRADAYYLSSTACILNNAELDAYIAEFAKSARLVVVNEPWWPRLHSLNPFILPRPEDVPVDAPYCAGQYSKYHHNYVAKFERAGFRVISSEIVENPRNRRYYAIQVVAGRDQDAASATS